MEREHQEILSNLRTQLGRVILGKPDVIVRAEYSSNGISIDPFYAEMGGQNLVPLEEYSQAVAVTRCPPRDTACRARDQSKSTHGQDEHHERIEEARRLKVDVHAGNYVAGIESARRS